MAAKSVRQVTLDFCKKKKTTRNCPALLLSRHFSFRQRLAGKLTRHSNCGKLFVHTARFLRCVCRSFECSRPAGKPRGRFASCPQLRKLVSEKNGPEVHSKFLHHRAHRPRQVHAGRPPPRNDRRAHPARNARTVPRLHGPRARARHHHQSEKHSPALQSERWKYLSIEFNRYARPRGFFLRSFARPLRLRRRTSCC